MRNLLVEFYMWLARVSLSAAMRISGSNLHIQVSLADPLTSAAMHWQGPTQPEEYDA